jgi:hypothetical protein
MKLDSDMVLCELLTYIRDENFDGAMLSIDDLKQAILDTGLPQVSSADDEYCEVTVYGKVLD